MALEYKSHIRKPFFVQAVEVTEDNMEEVAELFGTVQVRSDGVKYIEVDPEKMPNITKVYVGYWLTKVGDYVRCYKPRLFKAQFEAVQE